MPSVRFSVRQANGCTLSEQASVYPHWDCHQQRDKARCEIYNPVYTKMFISEISVTGDSAAHLCQHILVSHNE